MEGGRPGEKGRRKGEEGRGLAGGGKKMIPEFLYSTIGPRSDNSTKGPYLDMEIKLKTLLVNELDSEAIEQTSSSTTLEVSRGFPVFLIPYSFYEVVFL